MRKKVNIVGVLVVLIMVLFMTGCHTDKILAVVTTPTEENLTFKLEFKERGVYERAAFGEEVYVYRFDEPNSTIVVYETLDGIFLVGEYDIEKGISYGNVFMPGREFIALSNKYFLFKTEEGEIAVEIERKKYVELGEEFYNEYSYDELSDKEKSEFVYPVERKKEKW